MASRRAARIAPPLAAALLAVGPGPLAADASPPALPLATFDEAAAGSPPGGWEARGGEAGDVYVVQKGEGGSFLRADARGLSVQIGRREGWDVRRYPVLTWRWRARVLPRGADEGKKPVSDSAAGVYVVFGGWPVPETLKYVWSSGLPPGSRIDSPFSGRVKIVVLRSGAPRDDAWVEERVDLVADYRRAFGRDPDRARGIGILSDSDSTGTRASADYDDIVARAAGAPAR